MKKIAFLLIAAALLASCAKNDPPENPNDGAVHDNNIVQNDVANPSDSTPEIDNTVIIPTDDTAADEQYQKLDYAITARDWDAVMALPLEAKATEFLSALCQKDEEVLNIYIEGDSVKELLKADIDAKIGEGKPIVVRYADADTAFMAYLLDVRLDVSNSKTEFLPDASYYYTLRIAENRPFVEYFGGRERYEIFDSASISSSDEELCSAQNFILQAFHERNLIAENGFDVNTNFNSIFHAAVHELMAQNDDFVLKTTLDEFKQHIRLRFGYTDESIIDKFAAKLTESSFITVDAAGNYSGSCAHGYSSMMKELSSLSTTDDTAIFTYTLFADSAHMMPCAEVKFTFVKNADSAVMTLSDFEYRALNSLSTAIVSP